MGKSFLGFSFFFVKEIFLRLVRFSPPEPEDFAINKNSTSTHVAHARHPKQPTIANKRREKENRIIQPKQTLEKKNRNYCTNNVLCKQKSSIELFVCFV